MWFVFYAIALLTKKIQMLQITFSDTVNGISIMLNVHAGINCVADSPTVKVLTSYKAAIIIVVVFMCIVALLITLYTRWHLELCLFWKDRFGKLEDGNKSTYVLMLNILCCISLC